METQTQETTNSESTGETYGEYVKDLQPVVEEGQDNVTTQEETPQETSEETQLELPNTLGRNYEGLAPEDKQLFSRMSNEAYNKLFPIYTKSKTLEQELAKVREEATKAKELTLYEADNAWTITPQYRELQSDVQQLDAIDEHWHQQMDRIEAGEKWSRLDIDENGKVVALPPEEATSNARHFVRQRLMSTAALNLQAKEKLNTYSTTFRSKHSQHVTEMKKIADKIFEGNDPAQLDKAMQAKIRMFPSYLHTNPFVQTLAKALAVIDGLTIMNKQQLTKASANQLKGKLRSSSGPTAEGVQQGNGKGNTVGSIFDEFDRAKAEGVM